MDKDDQCEYCPFSNLPAHLNKLISLSFFNTTSFSRHVPAGPFHA